MKYIRLEQNDLQVLTIALGTWEFGGDSAVRDTPGLLETIDTL